MREFIYQESKKGCGLACLRMALIEASGQANYKYLRFEKHPPYSLKELCLAAKKEGASLEFFKVNNGEIVDFSANVPLMTTIREGNAEHLVYVPKARKNKLLVYDPAFGPQWVKKDVFLSKWDYVFGKITSIEKRKCPYKKPKIFSPWSLIPSFVSVLISFLCLFGCFYLMKNDSNYIFSLSLLAGSAIFEIVSRILMIKSMKKFDEKWIDKIPFSSNHLEEQYQHYCSFKKAAFHGHLSMVTSLFMALSTIALFGINNPLFFISVAAIAVYSTVSSLFLRNYICKKKTALEEKEKLLFLKREKPDEIKKSLRSLTDEGYKIGSLLGNEKAISLILIAVLSIVPLLNQENIVLNYYLLHFGGLYTVSEALANILEFAMSYKIREREKMYFYEYFAKDDF